MRLPWVARGDALVTIVESLEPLVAEVTAVKELKKRKAELEAQKRDQSQKLLDDIRNLDEQIRQHEPAEEDDDGESDVADAVSEDAETHVVASLAREDRQSDLTADFIAEPKAFLEDVIVRLDIIAAQAERLFDFRQDVLPILAKIITATEIIEAVLTDEALEPVPVPNE